MNMLEAKKYIYFILIVLSFNIIFSQGQFVFEDQDKRAVTLKFKSINNLIILSGQLNGKQISFLVDTGVNKTKVFGVVKDSTDLDQAEYINLRSLGSTLPVKAYKTRNNTIDFGPILSHNQEVYFITDPRYDLASKLGIDVQGIIGYDFLKDFIFRLNYNQNTLRVYQHHKFNRKLNSFDKLDFRFIFRKPHIKIPVEFLDGSLQDLVFLLDSGSSDAFWVFENETIEAPEESFLDFVGYGLEKVIEGKRTKLESASIGKFELKQPRAAFIDSTSAKIFTADRYKNGIIGGEVLKRFIWFFDYKNQHIYLKTSPMYDDTFNYDRSGLVLIFVGEEINKIRTPVFVKVGKDQKYNSNDENPQFEIRLQVSKIIKISQIRPNSPASKVDIQVGDRILKLNRKSLDRMSVNEINSLLSSDEGKRIKIELKRGNNILKREIYLSSQLNINQED